MRSCGDKDPIDYTRLDKLIADSADARKQHERDSINQQWLRDSAQAANESHRDNAALQANEILRQERTIRTLIARVKDRQDVDTSICCAVANQLADTTEKLIKDYGDLKQTALLLEDNYRTQLAQSDTTIALLRADYYRAVRNFDTCVAIAARQRQNLKRSGLQIYMGLGAQYSVAQRGIGPEVLVKTKGDKIIRASYHFTNTQPSYQVGYAFKISFRK